MSDPAFDNSAPAAPFSCAAAECVGSFAEAGLFAGTVLVATGKDVLLRQAFGLADREWSIPHVPEGKFRLGSLTKQFTATAVLQLREQGRLRLEDRIEKFYPEAPQSWHDVTLFHLLTHSSGIPSYTSMPGFFERTARLDHSPLEIIALTRDAPLFFEPGTQFKYNNGGYVILGHVIERVCGLDYGEYVTRNILIPLGLEDTGYERDGAIIPLRTRGYRFTDCGIENAAYLSMSVPHAAGSIYSTADDLLAWLEALRSEKLIGRQSFALMTQDHGHGYGMGFAIQSQFSRHHLVHAGGINGFSVVLSHYPEADLTIIILANLQGAPVQKMARDIAALFFGVSESSSEIALDPALLADYVGLYRLGESKFLHVTQEGARLFAEWTGSGRQEAVAVDDHHFRGKWDDWTLTFESDGVALASRAILHRAGRDLSGPRIEA